MTSTAPAVAGPRRTRTALAAVLAAVAVALAALAMLTPASASTLEVRSGGVSVRHLVPTQSGPHDRCTVVDGSGAQVQGQSCEVGAITAGEWWGSAGQRQANLYIAFEAEGVHGDHRIAFTVDLSAAQSLPQGWDWASSGLRDTGGSYTLRDGYTCSDLPVLRGQTPAGWGTYPRTWVDVVEQRSGAYGIVCS